MAWRIYLNNIQFYACYYLVMKIYRESESVKLNNQSIPWVDITLSKLVMSNKILHVQGFQYFDCLCAIEPLAYISWLVHLIDVIVIFDHDCIHRISLVHHLLIVEQLWGFFEDWFFNLHRLLLYHRHILRIVPIVKVNLFHCEGMYLMLHSLPELFLGLLRGF